MTRMLICGIIVLCIIALGFVYFFYTDNALKEIYDRLEAVEASFVEKDGEKLEISLVELETKWDSFNKKYFFIVDNEHILEIDALVTRIISLAGEEDDELIHDCRVARALVRSYQKEQVPGIYNIL